jgi:RNA polymerase sigma-70 factor (ECF subfamily)
MITDASYLQRIQRFEKEALAELYDRFSPGIYRYAMRLLGEADLAEECVAETFSRFLHGLQAGKGPDRYIQAYLYRIAHNWIADHFRRRPQPVLSLEEDWLIDGELEPHQEMVQNLEREQVRAALVRLSPEQRQVIVLKYLEDFPHEEIAQVMNKPVGAVKALQHRGLAALRRLLVGEGDAPSFDGAREA